MFDALSMWASDMQGVADSIRADLSASAAMAGTSQAAAGQFQVDLAALYKHHNDVCDVYDRLSQKILSLHNEAIANSYPASQIPGVQRALETTWGTVSGGNSSGNSMLDGLTAVLGLIGNYANAVGDVYKSYVKADAAGASTLSAASNPAAASVAIPAAS